MDLTDYGLAFESALDPEQTADSLLSAIRQNVNSQVNSIEAAAALENKLSEEAVSFNQCLLTLDNTFSKLSAGEIDKDEALATSRPIVAALKTKCKALSLAGARFSEDDISEEEIAIIREVIVGAKDIVSARKKELEDCSTSSASEGYMNSYSPASEGLFDPSKAGEIRKSSEAKTATILYKNAKKLYSMGSKEKAVEQMKKAKSLYEKCLATLKKHAGMYNVRRTVSGSGVKDKFNTQVTNSFSAAAGLAYFEDRIDTCQAYLMKWKNKEGAGDIKAFKESLKAERKSEKARIKAERKKAQEAYMGLESYLDTLESALAMSAVMEASGSDGDNFGARASEIGSKYREGFKKLESGKKSGNTAEARAGMAEIEAATREYNQLESEADTPEKKKKLGLAAKIAIGAAATAITAAAVFAGVKSGAFKNLGEKLKSLTTKKPTDSGKNDVQLALPAAKQLLALPEHRDPMYENGRGERTYVDPSKASNVTGLQQSESIIPPRNEKGQINKKRPNSEYSYKRAPKNGAPAKESFTGTNGVLAFLIGNESDVSLAEHDESIGRAFDDTDMFGNSMISDADECGNELNELATESTIMAWLAEDGLSEDIY